MYYIGGKTMGFQLCNEMPAEELATQNLDGFVAQVKYDGRRVQIQKINNGGGLNGKGKTKVVKLIPRSDNIDEYKYPEVASLTEVPNEFIIDGEMCVFDEKGVSDFNMLISRDKTKDRFKLRLMAKKHPVTYVAFDILELDGKDLREEPYIERQRLLMETIKDIPNVVVAEIYTDPIKLYKKMVEDKQEGIILKNAQSKYESTRSPDWIKVKRKEYVIVRFDRYDIHNKGITLENEQGTRVACLGTQSAAVRQKIDKDGYANVEIARLGGRTSAGKHRQPTFSKLMEG